MGKVFISYSRKDAKFAKRLTGIFKKASLISGSTGKVSRAPWIKEELGDV